jgi:hypothetical protein
MHRASHLLSIGSRHHIDRAPGAQQVLLQFFVGVGLAPQLLGAARAGDHVLQGAAVHRHPRAAPVLLVILILVAIVIVALCRTEAPTACRTVAAAVLLAFLFAQETVKRIILNRDITAHRRKVGVVPLGSGCAS